MSGFFTASSLLKAGSELQPLTFIGSRFLRLCFLMIVPTMWALCRKDPAFYDEGGSLETMRLAGWLGLFGVYLPYGQLGQWFMNISLTPCWYIVAEFHCSVFLILVVPPVVKRFGHSIWPYACLIAACAVVSVAIALSANCADVAMGEMINGAGLDQAMSMMTSNSIKRFFNDTYGWTAAADIEVPASCISLQYSMSQVESGYVHSHTRFCASLVGAAFAAQYHWMQAQPLAQSKPGCREWSYFILALLGSYAVFAPQNLNKLMKAGSATPPLAAMVGLWQVSYVLLSISWLFVIYSCLMPVGHRFHAPRAARVYGASVWHPLAALSPWLYVLHWPIAYEVLRYSPTAPVGWGAGLRLFAQVLPITLIIAVLCQRFLEPGFSTLQLLVTEGGAVAKARQLEEPLTSAA